MVKKTKKKIKRKRGPSHRTAGRAPKGRRGGQRDALTLEKFRRLVSSRSPRSVREHFEILDTYRPEIEHLSPLDKNQTSYVWDGDLLLLRNALDRCLVVDKKWLSKVEASFPEQAHRMCVVPAWLLGQVLLVLSQGIGGRWPTTCGQHAHEGQRQLAACRDLVRAHKVLTARQNGLAWKEAYRWAAKELGEDSGETVKGAYVRVRKRLRKDPQFYQRIGPISLRILEAAGSLPWRGDR